MSTRLPPRYLPTLTEVVQPTTQATRVSAEPSVAQAAPYVQSHMPAPAAPLDRNQLAQQIIQQVRPRLEAELRSIAQELFEAQFSALLPSLQLQIEETVRDAIDQALPDQADTNN
jgi:hypothetical protein